MKMTRRNFLQHSATSLAATGLAVSPSWAKQQSTNRKLVMIVLTGGPSQLDTWDPKPNAPANVRSPFRPIRTQIPGICFTELFPKMAANNSRFQIVRSVYHTAAPIHETGWQLLQTGQFTGADIVHPSFANQRGHGVLLPAPLNFAGVNLDHGQTNLARVNMDVSADPARVRFGQTAFGDDCLRACRLLETGTNGIVINMFTNVYDATSWDCHAAGGSLASTLDDYRQIGPMFDTAFIAMLDHLEATGLLAETEIIASGEFGRTPQRNERGGRDHWAGVWTAIRAGGRFTGGTVIGSSDMNATEPIDQPVAIEHLYTEV